MYWLYHSHLWQSVVGEVKDGELGQRWKLVPKEKLSWWELSKNYLRTENSSWWLSTIALKMMTVIYDDADDSSLWRRSYVVNAHTLSFNSAPLKCYIYGWFDLWHAWVSHDSHACCKCTLEIYPTSWIYVLCSSMNTNVHLQQLEYFHSLDFEYAVNAHILNAHSYS